MLTSQGYTVFSIPVGVIYRPNEAKVKNLKTKDYLGKARLIATSNDANRGVGFIGAERKEAAAALTAAKDDRPPENISYAATNLVQRNLSSRIGREQSAPPVIQRNMFPPTPPPEERSPGARGSTGSANLPVRTSSMRNPVARNMVPLRETTANATRSMSVRQGPRPEMNEPRPGMLGRAATFDIKANATQPMQKPRQNSWEPERPRLAPIRTASEPRGPPLRRDMVERSASQKPLYREMHEQADDTVDEYLGMYSRPTKKKQRTPYEEERRLPYTEEEDEYIDDSEMTPDELVSSARSSTRVMSSASTRRASSRSHRPDMRKIRVKVHANDDTRYIMIGAAIDFGEFESKIREKFGLKEKLKIKIQDEGDMITLGDQEDLDFLVQSVRATARKEKSEMGKMEIWVV